MRRKHAEHTENSLGEYIENVEPDYYYKQSDTDYGSSVFTVESYRTSDHMRDSDPVYQEIREKVQDNSDGGQDAPDISDEVEVIEYSDDKESQKPIFVTKSNVINNKPSIVYGVITAKEMTKYRPSTPNIIRR